MAALFGHVINLSRWCALRQEERRERWSKCMSSKWIFYISASRYR